MTKITNVQRKQILRFAEENCKNNDLNHDFRHAKLTAKFALLLAKLEGADKEACEIAGLLHDVSHRISKEHHAKLGADSVKQFLKKIKVDPKLANKICLAIAHHNQRSYAADKRAKTQEEKVVFDADRLSALGPMGFCRDFTYCLLYQKMHPYDAVIDGKNYVLTRYNQLKTKSAKKIGKKPQEVMDAFYRIFESQQKP